MTLAELASLAVVEIVRVFGTFVTNTPDNVRATITLSGHVLTACVYRTQIVARARCTHAHKEEKKDV